MKRLMLFLLLSLVLFPSTAIFAEENELEILPVNSISPQEASDIVGENMYFNMAYGQEVRAIYYFQDPDELYGREGHIFFLHTSTGFLMYRIFGDVDETYYTSGIIHDGEYDFSEVRWIAMAGGYIYAVAVEDEHAWMMIASLEGCSWDFCPKGPSGIMIVRDARQLGALPDFSDLANMYPEMVDDTLTLTTPEGVEYNLGALADGNSLLDAYLEHK